MAILPVYNMEGSQAGELEVPDPIFGAEPDRGVLHQVVVGQLASRRQGTAHAKTRSEVAGSTRKLWRQKGTGRARVGDRRPPHRVGGGVAIGPQARSHRQRTPRRVKAAALRSALSARAREGNLTIVEKIELPEPKTRVLAEALVSLGVQRPALLVLAEPSQLVWRCGRNIPGLNICPATDVSSYDVMAARTVIVESAAIGRLEARLS